MKKARLEFHTGDMELEPTTIESCHSMWIFDTERMRFRRILKGPEVGGQPVATGWRSYYWLESSPDSESFTVFLNVTGTNMIRSWRHGADCAQCSEHVTRQLSLETLRAMIDS